MSALRLGLGLGLMRSARATTALTKINGASIATSDIIAWLDVAPASGPILIPDLVRDGWSNPSGGHEQVYVSDSARAYAAIVAGEVPVVGDRRVENALATRGEVDPSQSGWSKITGGTGTVAPVTTGAFASGPGGTAGGAVRVQFDASGGTLGGDTSTLRHQLTNQVEVAHVFSCWLKLNAGVSDQFVIELIGSAETVTVTDQWQRFSVAAAANTTWRIDIEQRGNVGSGDGDLLIAIEPGYEPQLEIDLAGAGVPGEGVSSTAPIGTAIANNTGTICAPGVAYFVTKNANTVDGNGVVTEAVGDRISGIDGIVVRGAATNLVTKADGTGWGNARVTTTPIKHKGLDGVKLTTDSTSGAHYSREGIIANNPNRCAGNVILKRDNHDLVNLVTIKGSIQFNFASETITHSTGSVEFYVEKLDSEEFLFGIRDTADQNSTTAYLIIAIPTVAGSLGLGDTHTTSGLSVDVIATTLVTNSGGTTLPFPGIINNNTGATLLRQAMAPTIAKSAADLGTRGPELVTNGGFDADVNWTKGGTWEISGGSANATPGGSYTLSQSNVFEIGKYYEVRFEVKNHASGLVRLQTPGAGIISRTANGIYTEYLVAGSTALDFLTNGELSIDNVSVREVIPNHAFMVAYKQPSVWPAAGGRLLHGETGDGIFFVNATAQLGSLAGSFQQNWSAGNTAAGSINRDAITTDGLGGLRHSVNGGAVEIDADADAYNPTFTKLHIGRLYTGSNYSQLPIQQLLIVKRALTDAELQGITS